MKHTPGPWSFHQEMNGGPDGLITKCETFDALTVYIGQGEKLIAQVEAYTPTDDNGYPCVSDFDECRANARLIAAAPELLEALRRIGEYTGKGPCTTPWQRIVEDVGQLARAAIAKAEAGDGPTHWQPLPPPPSAGEEP
jgi:hypothetical protein